MDLSCIINGIKLDNPLMPASGPLVGDYEKMKMLERFGVGAMVSKTISTKAANVPRPCIYGTNNYIMNCELWSEYGPDVWFSDIFPKYKNESNIPLIISLGYSKEDMQYLVPLLDKYADAFEISTHYVGKDLTIIGETVKTIRKNTSKPFYMKLSPHMPDPIAFCRVVKENGANGVVATNSLGPTMAIDLETRSVKIGNDYGIAWSSGPAIKPISLALVNIVKEAMEDFTVIGVGGIKTAEDVLEFLLVGADAVQMLSSALIYGKDLYKKIIEDLPRVLKKYGFNSVEEVIATKLNKVNISFKPIFPKFNNKRCSKCGLCSNICPYLAISMNDYPVLNEKKCFGCSLCKWRCPVKAIY